LLKSSIKADFQRIISPFIFPDWKSGQISTRIGFVGEKYGFPIFAETEYNQV